MKLTQLIGSACLASTLTACASDTVAPNPVDIVGTYSLTSINGHSLPDTIFDNTLQPQKIITAGHVLLAANHVYSGSLTVINSRLTIPGAVQTIPLVGDYAVSKYTVTFQDAVFGGTETGSWHGKTIVWDFVGRMVFTRDTVVAL